MSQIPVTALPPPEVIEAFSSSLVTALRELTQLAAEPADWPSVAPVLADDSVVAAMLLQRPVPGRLTLVLPPAAARALAEAYLPAGADLTDELQGDVAGELANVVAGQAKTILKDSPYHFFLSIPTVSRLAQCEPIRGAAIACTLGTAQVVLYIDLSPPPAR